MLSLQLPKSEQLVEVFKFNQLPMSIDKSYMKTQQ